MAKKKTQMTQSQFEQSIKDLNLIKPRFDFRKSSQVIKNKKKWANKNACRKSINVES